MKTCMISQFNVDYTPNGIALNRGGRPSAIRINMVMTEAAIHTKSDYMSDTQKAVEATAEVINGDTGQPQVGVDDTTQNAEGGPR